MKVGDFYIANTLKKCFELIIERLLEKVYTLISVLSQSFRMVLEDVSSA